MSAFYNNNITDKGRQLFALLQDGGVFYPTKIVMGSGYMPAGVTTRTITDVVAPFTEFEINKHSPKENGDYILGGMFSNAELIKDEYWRELGLYAYVKRADGTYTDEVLYSYGNAFDDAELIPKYGTSTVINRQIDVITYVGNDAQVIVEVVSGLYVDTETFEIAIGDLQSQIDALKPIELALTLTAAGWTTVTSAEGEPYYTQTLTAEGVTVNRNGFVGISDTATREQYNAALSAILRKTAQGNGTLEITANGEKPTVDIPITVILI